MAKNQGETAHFLADKHIIVAGAGIAGLAFVRALDLYWPDGVTKPKVTMYEKREDTDFAQREGYSISIRSDRMSGGMQALQRLGLLDQILAASITGQHGGRGSFRIWDANWKTVVEFNQPKTPPDGLPGNSMRIARYVLRKQLQAGLPSTTTLHSGTGCASATALPDGRMRIVLTDGSTADCNLLIAADGANSKIRASLRPHDTLSFAGATMITGISQFPEGLPSIIKEDHGALIGGNGNSLFVSPVDDTSAVWSISFLSDEPRERLRGLAAVKAQDRILNEARARGDVFAEPFTQLVDATNASQLMVVNAMDKMPIAHSEMTSEQQHAVVFIGDANHAVSPFAGNGANIALMDAVELAVELCNSQDLKTAVTAYDAKSIPRAKRTVKTSHQTISMIHSTGWKSWLWIGMLHGVNFLMSF